jgi:hypothetical protein
MNVTTRTAARRDWTRISPLAAFKETATNSGFPFLNRVPLVIRARGNNKDSLFRCPR